MQAHNERVIAAPPATVAAVLADRELFPQVAAGRSGEFEGDWPQVGSVCTVQRGVGPLHAADVMRVTRRVGHGLQVVGGTDGVLTGTVTIDVEPVGADRTRVRLTEEPTGGVGRHLPGLRRLLEARNEGVLARLEQQVGARS
ncbi:hypothetical protein GB931_11065 [Modestobacter sp. I12A-02628]|uniref:Polyketide cyclase / dehydrase and lipid transport n=1 Tax=Goekera deserti TaxID=2497753 RepID=A0A7K3WCB7_9ACTN|nr:SRPBCC family protein [Goekera deserti]MPQ98447.1 hypothetical protein [Goekera deserti]NDI48275.1 hypothetical protein [Goekera deserti]NEL54024.1 hypothetical protein [Goekera deserti]